MFYVPVYFERGDRDTLIEVQSTNQPETFPRSDVRDVRDVRMRRE